MKGQNFVQLPVLYLLILKRYEEQKRILVQNYTKIKFIKKKDRT